MSNTIGQWNPAWGPKPEKVRPRSAHEWHMVCCPRVECANAEGYLVCTPITRDGGQPAEVYRCAVCGAEMRQERVQRGRQV